MCDIAHTVCGASWRASGSFHVHTVRTVSNPSVRKRETVRLSALRSKNRHRRRRDPGPVSQISKLEIEFLRALLNIPAALASLMRIVADGDYPRRL